MNYEVEIKARVRNYVAIKQKLHETFEYLGSRHKRDAYFESFGLPTTRMRVIGEDRPIITVKQKSVFADGVEVNKELEFDVNSYDFFEGYLDALGYHKSFEKIKETELYAGGDLIYELNRVADLGDYLEVEGLAPDETLIDEFRKRVREALLSVGVAEDDVETRSYRSMIEANRGKGHGSRASVYYRK